MENKRVEMTKGMESKIKDMETALQAIQAKFVELEDVKGSGAEAVAGLQAKKAQIQEEMQLATDLGEAELLLQQVEDIERKEGLQTAINNGQAVRKAGEMDELFKAFFAVHAGARTIFNVLDKEYVETMSIRSVDEDTAKVEGYACKLNTSFGVANSLLIDAGLVPQGAKFYGKVHLGQSILVSKGGALKREMVQLQRRLSI
ncbi:hypothetical protein [Peribacillus sp. YIM B13482]|uniref:hypothetical protein n=1 Tax=Peribacillus sp. YIM B13482 TaxID=3366298 RepID=UPI00366AAAFE